VRRGLLLGPLPLGVLVTVRAVDRDHRRGDSADADRPRDLRAARLPATEKLGHANEVTTETFYIAQSVDAPEVIGLIEKSIRDSAPTS
jgi:hypothetical protein